MDPHVEEPQPKRRKVRKGTRTCWECKRRKVRCTFESPNDAVCIGCTRRCLRCISQEFPEETTPSSVKSRLVGDRIVRVEAMIQQLVHQSGNGMATAPVLADINLPSHTKSSRDSSPSPNLLTPEASNTSASICNGVTSRSTSIVDDRVSASGPHRDMAAFSHDRTRSDPDPLQRRPLRILDFQAPVNLLIQPKEANDRLSEALLSVYPPQSDLDLIASCTSLAYSYYQVIFRSHREIKEQGFFRPTELCTRYTPQTHPVIIARQMLLIAMVLQISDLAGQKELDNLSEPLVAIMSRLGDTAINLVTTNDALLDTLDGLECIMLEAIYRGNSGYLRRAWLTWRRAFSMAQLMCIPRQNRHQSKSIRPAGGLDPQFLWYRIISAERIMCLLLGLPQASLDASMAPAEILGNDTPMAEFEQKMSMIASYISDRNERGSHSDDYATTEKIDKGMQKIAASLPGRWWLAPNLAALPPGDDSVWETLKLSNQIFYYHLLHQLHLPYMMHPTSTSDVDQRRFEYSRMTCVSSSREILSRYIVFRNFNKIACCYRIIEFFALMASLTLILIHLDGHRNAKQANSFLAHQRLSDRAMTEEVLESMDLVRKLNEDAISETSVELLRQLLAIEADIARGSDNTLESCGDDVCSAGELRISVPYVGLVTIGRDGTVTREMHEQTPIPTTLSRSSTTTSEATQAPSSQKAPVGAIPHVFRSSGILTPESATLSTAEGLTDATCTFSATPLTQLGMQAKHDSTQQPASSTDLREAATIDPRITPTASVPPNNFVSPQTVYPRPTAGSDQWAFQGVDMAFFENLIRETNIETGQGSSNLWM